MFDKKVVRVDEVTHQHIKILASSTRLSIEEYLAMVIRDEWAAFQRKDVSYRVIDKKDQN
jgi:predicted ATP-grasp superfamily ATP-dependent carboligase